LAGRDEDEFGAAADDADLDGATRLAWSISIERRADD